MKTKPFLTASELYADFHITRERNMIKLADLNLWILMSSAVIINKWDPNWLLRSTYCFKHICGRQRSLTAEKCKRLQSSKYDICCGHLLWTQWHWARLIYRHIGFAHSVLCHQCSVLPFYSSTIDATGCAVAHLVEALRYKPEGRKFDFRWCQWNFSLT